jgi:hypothetical protein
VRERPRLRVACYAYEIATAGGSVTLAANFRVTNFGAVPAYVSGIALVDHLPWQAHVPLLRSASYKTLSSRWLRWVLKGARLNNWRVEIDVDLMGRLEPGESKQGRLVDIVNGTQQEMPSSKVEHNVLREHPYAVVETGVRRYWSRVADQRKRFG